MKRKKLALSILLYAIKRRNKVNLNDSKINNLRKFDLLKHIFMLLNFFLILSLKNRSFWLVCKSMSARNYFYSWVCFYLIFFSWIWNYKFKCKIWILKKNRKRKLKKREKNNLNKMHWNWDLVRVWYSISNLLLLKDICFFWKINYSIFRL